MAKTKKERLRPGDRVRVQFGGRVVDGTVTSVSGWRIHVALNIAGADQPVDGLYLESELLSA